MCLHLSLRSACLRLCCLPQTGHRSGTLPHSATPAQPRLAPDLPGGLRGLLDLDLGELATGTARPLRFTREDGTVQLETTASWCLMDEAAAGSGGLGDLRHGRYGDFSVLGATVSLDLALPDLSKHKGLGRLASVQCTDFFDAKGPRSAASRTQDRRARQPLRQQQASCPPTRPACPAL